MTYRIILLSLILQSSLSLFGQVAMGDWRTHFAYNSVAQIAQSPNKIYAISEGALFSIDKLDKSTEYYSTLTGLNASNIIRIEYDTKSNQLVIVYQNGNIDILSEDGVINIPDLYLKQMSISKAVNQINFSGDIAYLACDFGLVALNLKKREIADTYFIGTEGADVKVLTSTTVKDSIFAVSNATLYKASVFEPFLVNYQKWETQASLPGTGDIKSIVTFNEKLFLLRNGKAYKRNDDYTWTELFSSSNIDQIIMSNGSMSLIVSNVVYLVDADFQLTPVVGIDAPLMDVEFEPENQTYWFAAYYAGILSYKQNGAESPIISAYKPNGPAYNSPWDITFAGEKVFVVPGGRWASNNGSPGAVMIYQEGKWSNIYESEIRDSTLHAAKDFMNVAVDPVDGTHFFVTSFGNGLFEFRADKFYKWYNPSNSPLTSVIIDSPYDFTRLDGATYDSSGNLQLVNIVDGKKVVIRVLDPVGQWYTLEYPVDITQTKFPTLGKLMIPKERPSMKWIPSLRYAPGLFIADDNQTPLNASDDKWGFMAGFRYLDIDINNQSIVKEIYPSVVSCAVEDLDGVVWVGTNKGPVLFSDPSKVFDSDFYTTRVKIPRNDGSGLADFLLETEYVKCIAVDGANRKWIGTETSGLYLMSENGEETIKHFTTDNSPLPSNNILSLSIHPKTGEVFIGTGTGLVSYQSDASLGETAFKNVYAYPNPVRENYNGLITITGLMNNTQVKITDLTGNLICQTISNGSLATWDGKDVHGRKVSTGVYLAICANEDGTKSTITKILVIN